MVLKKKLIFESKSQENAYSEEINLKTRKKTCRLTVFSLTPVSGAGC